MTIKEAVKFSGLSLKEVHEMTGIPYRSLQNWTSGVRQPPDYVEEYLIKKLCQERQVARVKVSDDQVTVETLVDGEFELYTMAPIKDGMIPLNVLTICGNLTNEGYKVIYM
jgi:hypothetical protein